MAWDQRFSIAQLNIEHFRRLLGGDLSQEHRRTVEKLLREEEAKLADLKFSVAQDLLMVILGALAETAQDGLGAAAHSQRVAQIASFLERLPCAVGVIDAAGELRIQNAQMSRYLPKRIPSRDSEQVHRWHFPTEDGGRLNPFLWPSARALRGEAVTPGIEGYFTDAMGERIATRVASFPVRPEGEATPTGAISAVYQTQELLRDGNGRTLEKVFEEVTPLTKINRQDRG